MIQLSLSQRLFHIFSIIAKSFKLIEYVFIDLHCGKVFSYRSVILIWNLMFKLLIWEKIVYVYKVDIRLGVWYIFVNSMAI